MYKRDGADFDPSIMDLSDNTADSFNPAVAVSDNKVHLVWQDSTSGPGDIFYKRSTDGGATFGPTLNLSDNPNLSHHPAIAVSGDNVYVVWHDETPGNLDIPYKRSTDGGASFVEPTKNLSNNAGGSFSAAIAVAGNTVHVVWKDNTPGNLDILYRRSVDGGSTFQNLIINLSANTEDSSDPEIEVSGSNVHVVWSDNTDNIPNGPDILYRRSVDSGTTFLNIITNLSGKDPFTFSDVLAIAAKANNVYVVWGDEISGNHEILYRKSTDNGFTFDPTLSNLSTNTAVSHTPAIAVS